MIEMNNEKKSDQKQDKKNELPGIGKPYAWVKANLSGKGKGK
jgi:hypothetical protein